GPCGKNTAVTPGISGATDAWAARGSPASAPRRPPPATPPRSWACPLRAALAARVQRTAPHRPALRSAVAATDRARHSRDLEFVDRGRPAETGRSGQAE